MVRALGHLVNGAPGVRPAEPFWFDGAQRAIEVEDLFEAVLGNPRLADTTGSHSPVEVVPRA